MARAFSFLVALAVASYAAAAPGGWSFNNMLAKATNAMVGKATHQACQGAENEGTFTLNELDINPNPPVVGKKATIVLKGTAAQTVERGAKVEVTVDSSLASYAGLNEPQLFDICSGEYNTGVKCPVPAGPVTISNTIDIPEGTPALIPITLKIKGKSKNGKQLFCRTISLQFAKPEE